MSHLINFDAVYDRRGSDCKKYNPGRYPEDVLPMWIADTDFKSPAACIQAARDRIDHECLGYPYELPAFNQAVVRYMQVRHQWDIQAEWVEFATGVVPAAIFTIRAFTQPGDQIVVNTPLYSPLREAVRDNGRILVEESLVCEDGQYQIDFDRLEARFKEPRTKLFILCNPHNPIGRAWTRQELVRLADLCVKYQILVFNDEIHSDIVYPPAVHTNFHSLYPAIGQLTITSSNPGKTFNVAGVRTAYVIISNPRLMDAYRVARKNNKAMGRTVVGQQVFIAAYTQCDDYVDQLVPYLERNVDLAVQFIQDRLTEIDLIRPQATYLLWLDCRRLNLDQEDLMTLFQEEGKLGLNDGKDFGLEGQGFVRMNIAAPRSIVQEGLNRLEAAVQAWRRQQA